MVHIIIHKGTHQIGGCVTEIATKNNRVFIDFGDDLPDDNLPVDNTPPMHINIEGLTVGDSNNSALFLTHYHGDHIGRLSEVMIDVPVYMGQTAKAIFKNYANRIKADNISNIKRINTFTPLEKIKVGDIEVTPLMIDHSAFDAFMFIVQADGKRVLHTGDFRLHGVRGSKTLKMLKCYARNIDYIVCEGTTLSRTGKSPMTEYELQQKAALLMKESKYVFVLCSSTNIDRIGAFYHANPKGRMFICNEYIKENLDIVTQRHSDKSSFYDFSKALAWKGYLEKTMQAKGFCMLIQQGGLAPRVMERFKDNSLIIYSMYTGYLDNRALKQDMVDFLKPYMGNPYNFKKLHTSGHASPEDIKKVYETVKPKSGLIPIHTDSPELFRHLVPEDKVIFLNDGETIVL